ASPQNDSAGYSSMLQPFKYISSTSSIAPGTGIARNRNCPAYKNLHRFGASPAGARRFSEIRCGANRSRRDASPPFRVVDSTTVQAALSIRSKRLYSQGSKPVNRVQPKTETARLPECPQRGIHL